MDRTCPECGFQFTCRGSVIRHLSTRHGVGEKVQCICAECKRSFTTKYNLDRHFASFHSANPRTNLRASDPQPLSATPPPESSSPGQHQPSRPSRTFQCAYCGKSFNHKNTLYLHLRTHYSCALPTLDTLLRSPQPSTSTVSPESSSTSGQCLPSPPPRHRCAICGRSYKWRRDLTRHIRSKHRANESQKIESLLPSGPQPPSSTPPTESSSSSLPQPSPSTSGQCPPPPPPTSPPQKHKCAYCGKSYNWQSGLHRHVMKSHYTESSSSQRPPTPPPKYLCYKCGKSYKWRFDLTEHLKASHNDIESSSTSSQRPPTPPPRYLCDKCGKCYKWRFDLTEHLMTSHNDIVSTATSKDILLPKSTSDVEQIDLKDQHDIDSDTSTSMESLSQTELDTLLAAQEVDLDTLTNMDEWDPSEFEKLVEGLQSPCVEGIPDEGEHYFSEYGPEFHLENSPSSDPNMDSVLNQTSGMLFEDLSKKGDQQ